MNIDQNNTAWRKKSRIHRIVNHNLIMSDSAFPAGKLPSADLKALLSKIQQRDERLMVGPMFGEDAAILDMGDRCLIVTTDPITFATDRIGWYAVHVNANDIAAMGARPRWFFTVLLVPEAPKNSSLIETIMLDIQKACDTLNISIAGGHTEITPQIDRPIVIGQMLGEVDKEKLIRKTSLLEGDLILLTHGIAIEGTAILAKEKGNILRDKISSEQLTKAENYLFEPGISVVEAALTATETGEVHAMHDPTEGGLLSGLYELADAAGLGLRVLQNRINVLPETQAICTALGVNPLRLIASGALLIGTTPKGAPKITAKLEARGIHTTVIAEARNISEGRVIEHDGHLTPLVPSERDEIARLF